MKRLPRFILLLAVGAVALFGAASCGDNSVACGHGTHVGAGAEAGTCVPDATCGPGTVEDPGTGKCVPDGSVICPQGTVFVDGHCQLDDSACADGTVLVDGQCVPEDDTLVFDHDEAAEPNDDPSSPAGMITLGAVDSSTVIHGCITPTSDDDQDGNPDPDFDLWIVTTSAPATIEITADGVHGLDAGFGLVAADPALAQPLANWRRFGINLTGDTAHRQVYLPAAGSYALLMGDGRSLFLDSGAAGGPDTCYFTTIKHVATPAPTALTFPATSGQDHGQVKLYSFNPPTTGRILDVRMNAGSAAMFPAFVVLRGAQNTFYASARGDGGSDTIGGLDTGETVTVVADMEYDYALTPQDYTFDLFDIAGQQLPMNGNLTLTKHNGQTPLAPFADLNYLYFDIAAANTLVDFNVVATTGGANPAPLPIDIIITRRDVLTATRAFSVIAVVDPFGEPGRTGGFANQFVRFAQPGRYYFVIQDPLGTSNETYVVNASFATVTPSPVVLGTPTAAIPLPANGNGFHTLDLTNPIWVQVGVTGTSFPANVGNARVSLYDLAGYGWLGGNYPAAHSGLVNADGTSQLGRILANDPRDYLVRVEPVGVPGLNPTYVLDVRNRDHVNLMTLTPGTPITRMNLDDVPAATATAFGVKRFIVFGASPGNSLTAMVTPTNALANIDVRRVQLDESDLGPIVNGGLAGAAETLNGSFLFTPNNWVAFEVRNRTTTTNTNVNLNLTSVAAPYQVTLADAGMVDACTGPGTEVLGTGLDDEFSTAQPFPAGWNFQFLGAPVSRYVIGANGLITVGDANLAAPSCGANFPGCWLNAAIPAAAAPNNLIAPLWNDYDRIKLCRRTDASSVTIQWTGFEYQSTPTVAFQVVFNMNGVINFIYGSGAAHTSTGGPTLDDPNGATIGLENATGAAGLQLSYSAPISSVVAGKRVTFTAP